MRIWLDAFELNNPDKRVYINPDIEGLDLPDIRTSAGQRAGQAGGYVGAQIFDSRHISIQGSIFSDSTAEALAKRREIQAALVLYPEVITVRIEDDDGYVYILYAQVISFKMPIGQFRGKSLFKLELEAPDPTIYDDTSGTSLSATLNKAISGGLLFSSTTPVFGSTFLFSPGQPNTSVDNSGVVMAFPVIAIEGQTTNPILTNLTTNQVFRLEGYGTSADSVTVIDMQAHTVTLNGGNAFGYVSQDSDFWGLVPGMNELSFDSGSGSDVTSATLTWRPGLRGI